MPGSLLELCGKQAQRGRESGVGGISLCGGAVFVVFVVPPGPGVFYVSSLVGTTHCATAASLRV